MKETQYVVLKFTNGDEIISKKSGSRKGYVSLSRPLLIQRSTILDPLTGNIKRNICIFRDWLEFTTRLECEIAEDNILLLSTPSPEMIDRYEKELLNLDRQIKGEKTKTQSSIPSKRDIEETEKLLEDYFKMIGNLSTDKPKAPDATGKPSNGFPFPPSNPGMVTAAFSMPPDVFLNIVLNMPMFDSWGQDIGDDGSDDEGFDDESDGEPPSPKKPSPNPKKKPNKDDDTPPDGWNGRFGFPKNP